MLAKKLEIVVYQNAGLGWHTECSRDPTWTEIEVAVHNLDRAEHPFFRMYLSEPEEASGLWVLQVVGGNGEYELSASDTDWREKFRFVDLARPKGPLSIDIWTTDQGASFEQRYLCNNMETVLRICKYFVENGSLEPSVDWEMQP